MSAKKRATRKPLYIILSVMLLIVIGIGIKVYEDVFASNIEIAPSTKQYVYVGTKLTLEENLQKWQIQNVIKHPDIFIRFVKMLGYESKLKPGRYEVKDGMSNFELLRIMASGKQTPVNITFKYAERKTDLAGFWSKQLEADSAEMVSLLNDPSLFEDIGLDTLNSIQACIPNTYNFYWNTSAEDALLRLKKEYLIFWNDDRKAKAKMLELTPAQVGVLASIVQKETYQTSEMPKVAGVYYNRLKRGMPFQADPTILFALNDKSIRRVSGNMLKIVSPYNSYTNKGLVPGPICVPSIQAIDAVLNLERHKYIYFCAKEDFSGFHRFAANFNEHMINARKYQRELNKKGIH